MVLVPIVDDIALSVSLVANKVLRLDTLLQLFLYVEFWTLIIWAAAHRLLSKTHQPTSPLIF